MQIVPQLSKVESRAASEQDMRDEEVSKPSIPQAGGREGKLVDLQMRFEATQVELSKSFLLACQIVSSMFFQY